jgi:hypothetical protein
MFCIKCGEKIDEGSRFCAKCGIAVNSSSVPYTPPLAETVDSVTRGKGKLLRIAFLIPVAFSLLWLVSVIVMYYKTKTMPFSTIGPGIFLVVITAISTLLTVIGEKKNKRKMILAAGILYIFSFMGIPSAIMCFIAFAKMKKQE